MNFRVIAMVAVIAGCFTGSTFAGSCCASKKKAEAAPVAAKAEKAEKKDGTCSPETSAKDCGTTPPVVAAAKQ